MFILDDLLIGLPMKGLWGVFAKIYEMAHDELTDTSKIKEELLQLQALYDAEEITDEEYDKKEEAILERLAIAVKET